MRRRSICSRSVLEERRQDHLRAEVLDAEAVDQEAGLLGRQLVEHAAGLAEVERVEVVAVDEARARHAGRGDAVDPALQLVVAGSPSDVVDDPCALAAALGRRRDRRRSNRRGGRRAARTGPPRPCGTRPSAARASARTRPGRSCRPARPRSRGSPSSAGTSGCTATSGASSDRSMTSSCARPSPSANARLCSPRSFGTPSAVRRSAQNASASCRTDAVDDAVHHSGTRPARDRAGVLEEGQVRARLGVLVPVEEVVDAGVVLVDGLRGQPQPEDARVEVDVAPRVARDRADVVDPLELHGRPPGVLVSYLR